MEGMARSGNNNDKASSSSHGPEGLCGIGDDWAVDIGAPMKENPPQPRSLPDIHGSGDADDNDSSPRCSAKGWSTRRRWRAVCGRLVLLEATGGSTTADATDSHRAASPQGRLIPTATAHAMIIITAEEAAAGRILPRRSRRRQPIIILGGFLIIPCRWAEKLYNA
jgi:hypothetical protein